MKSKVLMMALLALVVVGLAACGGGDSAPAGETGGPAPVGNVANGEKLFNQPVIGPNSAPGCVTCHSLEEGVVVVGPRVPGQTAEEYLRNSITHPNDYLVEGFAEGVMYQNYAAELTEEQINDLVAYLLTLQ
jgi:cytochrome c